MKECGPLSINCNRKELRTSLITAIESQIGQALSEFVTAQRALDPRLVEQGVEPTQVADMYRLNNKTFYGLIADCISRTGKENSSIFGTTHTAVDDFVVRANKAKEYSARACEAYKNALRNYPGANVQNVNNFKCFEYEDKTFLGGIRGGRGGRSKRKSYRSYRSTRPSPKYAAKEHRGKIKKGNDGRMYMSKPDKNGRYAWRLVKMSIYLKKN